MSTLLHPQALNAAVTAASAVRSSAPSLMKRFGAGIWRVLEAIGCERARRHLEVLASQYESSQPDLAAQLRAASLHDTRG